MSNFRDVVFIYLFNLYSFSASIESCCSYCVLVRDKDLHHASAKLADKLITVFQSGELEEGSI